VVVSDGRGTEVEVTEETSTVTPVEVCTALSNPGVFKLEDTESANSEAELMLLPEPELVKSLKEVVNSNVMSQE
jgi:hypothetical protein